MTVQTIPIDNIVIPDVRSNAVYTSEKLKELKESIASSGIQFPPLVRPLPDFKYEIIDGKHRYMCWKELGHPDIAVDVQDLTDEQAAIKHIVANHHRGESDPIGLSKVIRKLREQGKSYEDIGKLIGYSATTISKYETLLTLPDVVQQALTEGRMKLGHIQQIARLDDMTDISAAMTYTIQQKWTIDMLKYWVDARLAERQQAYNSPPNASGDVLMPPPPGPDLVQYRQCLCCGQHGLATEMSYWTIDKGCHDALEYLKSVSPIPWDAIQVIASTQDRLIKEAQEKDQKIKELSERLIDLSLRLAPPLPPQPPRGMWPPQPTPAAAPIQNTQSGDGSQRP